MGLRGFERRLERVVEGAFARAFRSEVKPLEIGRRLVRELDDHRTIDVRGRTVVPNHFTVGLSSSDHGHLLGIAATLCAELAGAAREHASTEGYIFVGPITVELLDIASLKIGTFTVTPALRELDPAQVRAQSHWCVVLPGGERILLGATPVVVGRHLNCDITIDDANLSRRHVEIRPFEDGYQVVDLGSTNASRINGLIIKQHTLRHGDELTIGASTIRFEHEGPVT